MTRFHATDKGNIPFTAEEEAARDREEAQAVIDKVNADKSQAAAAIKAELVAADLAIIRALTEGDAVRVKEHVKAQAKRRAKLK